MTCLRRERSLIPETSKGLPRHEIVDSIQRTKVLSGLFYRRLANPGMVSVQTTTRSISFIRLDAMRAFARVEHDIQQEQDIRRADNMKQYSSIGVLFHAELSISTASRAASLRFSRVRWV